MMMVSCYGVKSIVIIYISKHSVPILVGYDPTVYITSESIGFVELNISVFSHPVTGIPRPFTLSVTTQDGTASMPEMIS